MFSTLWKGIVILCSVLPCWFTLFFFFHSFFLHFCAFLLAVAISNHRRFSESLQLQLKPNLNHIISCRRHIPILSFLFFHLLAVNCSHVLVLLLFALRSILDFHCPDSVFTTCFADVHVAERVVLSLRCWAANSTQTPQRETVSCDRKRLQTGFLQVVVILIKEEIETCFEHFVPFSFKGWADFKKCWHGMKVRAAHTF